MATRKPTDGKKIDKLPPIKLLKKEPHPDYIYKAFLKALDTKQLPLQISVHYTVRATLRDLKAMAQFESDPLKTTLLTFIDKYEAAYLDGTGGGGGDENDPEILQGP